MPYKDELAAENDALRAEVKRLTTQRAAEKGPPAGTVVCFRREPEDFCRPATIVSDGFTEILQGPGGNAHRHALIEYGEPPWVTHKDDKGQPYTPQHGFQTDRRYDPTGAPGTWHLPDECPLRGGKGCPYAKGEAAPEAP